MLTSLRSGTPVYRLRPGTRVDSRGDTVRDWSNPERKRIPRAQVQDDATGAVERGSTITLSTSRQLLITGRFDLLPTDRIAYGGKTWAIDGEPIVVPLLTGGVHTEARLKTVEVV